MFIRVGNQWNIKLKYILSHNKLTNSIVIMPESHKFKNNPWIQKYSWVYVLVNYSCNAINRTALTVQSAFDRCRKLPVSCIRQLRFRNKRNIQMFVSYTRVVICRGTLQPQHSAWVAIDTSVKQINRQGSYTTVVLNGFKIGLNFIVTIMVAKPKQHKRKFTNENSCKIIQNSRQFAWHQWGSSW